LSSPLDADAVRSALRRRGCQLGEPLRVVAETTSTNDDVRALAQAGAGHGAVVIADSQSAGRGRGGKRWHSPAGENLYLSMLLRPSMSPERVPGLTLAVGVELADWVAGRLPGEAQVALKWPNDVYLAGRKLAGILAEAVGRGDGVSAVVMGIGLNVATRSFPGELPQATSLALAGDTDLDRVRIAADLVELVGRACRNLEQLGLAPVLPRLQRRDMLAGRRVAVGDRRGEAVGFDERGCLLLRGDDGVVQPVIAGEVRLVGR
jgi:BirA family biotin operon repressor/biotin-[acetyl-CoA-carboxylase] ligase